MQTLTDLRSGMLDGIRHLVLRENLTQFPDEVLRLSDTLEILDLSGNHLRHIPDSFERLSKLRIAFFSFNEFEMVPEVLGRCPSLEMVGFKANRLVSVPGNSLPERLRWLILTDNRIQSVPEALGSCNRLQKLMLSGNRIETLPNLSRCRNLELVRLANNRLRELPDMLLDLPNLAWLAFSGNPFCRDRVEQESRVSWKDLMLAEKIGEGASGVVYRAFLRIAGAEPRDVAVKVFKGSSTSDGLAKDEIFATLAAGSHPNLVPVIGRLSDHPDGSAGLVLALIPTSFRNLAAPPSFESCTRDMYDAKIHLSTMATKKIMHDMTALLDFLHGRGLCHGDFYAHNILSNGEGRSLLGDFGAAGFLGDLPKAQASRIVEIERRALHVLEAELASYAREASFA